jgi:DNA repair protein RadC
MTYSLRIQDLHPSDRPRERLLAVGARQLANSELIALLLGTGQGPGKLSAVGLGELLLREIGQDHQDPMSVLRDIGPTELMAIDGIGEAKAATILAAIEIGKRTFQSKPPERDPLDSPQAAIAYIGPELMWQTQERFAVLMLDTKNRPLGHRLITIGTATETLAHPRDIFRDAIRQGATTRLIIAHNHPSGNVEPSPADLELTRQLLQAAQLLAIPLLDHLILGHGNHRSLRQTTPLWDDFPTP